MLDSQPDILTIHVLIEHGSHQNFRATALQVPDCTIEAATRQQALDTLHQQLADRLQHAEVIPMSIQLPQPESAWIKFAGVFRNDPDFAEIAASLRRERENRDNGDVEDIVNG